MAQNFIESRREQGFLLPPDVRDWLAPDHLAWFLIDAVEQMDLSAFYAAYRADGHGAAAYEPSLMVAVILFAFSTGVRSSRAIERHRREHVAFRVITGNLVPDHVTVARFVCRHQQALSGLFTDVLKLCEGAGLVKSGVVSIDGTRIAGNANPDVNFHFEQIAREVLAEVRATDEAEDQELGEARGDELPEQLRTAEGRREFLRQTRERLLGDDADAERLSEDAGTGGEAGEEGIGGREADAAGEEPEDCALTEQSDGEAENEEPERRSAPEFEFDSSHITDAGGGRRRWLSEAKRQLEQHRWDNPDPISRSRIDRLLLALERLEAELAGECSGNEAYEAYRQQGRMRGGRRFGRPPDPHQPPEVPEGKVNVTDPDSRPIPIGFGFGFGFVQGYNAQTAVNEEQIVLAAEITNLSTDFSQLSPMVAAVLRELDRAGIDQELLEAVAADAGYWNEQQLDDVVHNRHLPVLVAPDKGSRGTPKRWHNEPRANWMRAVLKSDHGRERYAKRKQTVEPLYGDTKHNKGFIRFHRRGRIKVRTEFRLLMMAHNLTKVHRRHIATVAA
ncbi:MAG TPA: transposase [Solirubrobacteraceae bacterium]|jgi:transposase